MFSKNAEAEPLLEDGRGAKDVAPQGTKRSTRAFKIIGLVGLCVAALGATAVVASRTSHVETKTDEMVVAVESVCAGLAVSVVGLAAEPECEACALIAAAGDLFVDLWALVGTGTAVAAKVISDGAGTIIDDTPGNDFCPSDGLRYNCQDTTCKYVRPCSSNVVGQDESGKHSCACPYTKTLGQGEQMCDADGLYYNLADPTCNLERPCASNPGLMAGACPSFPPFIRISHPDLDLQFCDSDGLWYSLDVDFCKYSRKCASNNGLYASACPAPKPGYPDEQFSDVDGRWYYVGSRADSSDASKKACACEDTCPTPLAVKLAFAEHRRLDEMKIPVGSKGKNDGRGEDWEDNIPDRSEHQTDHREGEDNGGADGQDDIKEQEMIDTDRPTLFPVARPTYQEEIEEEIEDEEEIEEEIEAEPEIEEEIENECVSEVACCNKEDTVH